MSQIKVYYDTDTHDAKKIVVRDSASTFNPFDIDTDSADTAKFTMEGSSAVLSHSDCTGEFLNKAFDHVEQLHFVQAVTMEQEE